MTDTTASTTSTEGSQEGTEGTEGTEQENTETTDGQESTEGTEGEGTDGAGDGDGDDDPTSEKAIYQAKKRKLDSENKSLRDRLAAAEKLVREHEDATLSEKEKLARDLADAGQSSSDLRTELNRLKIQKEFPAIDDDLIEVVGDGDFDTMRAVAEKLAARLTSGGTSTTPPVKKSAPAGSLKGGSNPQADDDSVGDVTELVKGWSRF